MVVAVDIETRDVPSMELVVSGVPLVKVPSVSAIEGGIEGGVEGSGIEGSVEGGDVEGGGGDVEGGVESRVVSCISGCCVASTTISIPDLLSQDCL